MPTSQRLKTNNKKQSPTGDLSLGHVSSPYLLSFLWFNVLNDTDQNTGDGESSETIRSWDSCRIAEKERRRSRNFFALIALEWIIIIIFH